MLFCRRTDIRSRQENEYICLDKGHQQFDRHNKHGQRNGDDGTANCAAHIGAHFPENEDQPYKRHHDNMTCRDIGKKSQHEGDRPDKQTHDLHWGDDEDLDQCGHTWHPEDMSPVMFIAMNVYHDKRDDRQDRSYSEVTGYVTATENRDLTEEVEPEDEEEQRQEEWQKALPLLAQKRLGHLILDKEEDRLEKTLYALWRHIIPLLVCAGDAEEHPG